MSRGMPAAVQHEPSELPASDESAQGFISAAETACDCSME